MAIMNIPPTKTNLMKIKRSLELAREGFELLEQKREFLVLELLHFLDQAKIIEREVNEKLEKAYNSLRRLLLQKGTEEVRNTALGVKTDYFLKIKSHNIMGIELPIMDFEVPEKKVNYSLRETTPISDETQINFLEAIKLLARLAEIKTSILTLAREVKKTQRRVNALEKIVIPNNLITKKFIEDSLEEKDREAFFINKLIKEKLETTQR